MSAGVPLSGHGAGGRAEVRPPPEGPWAPRVVALALPGYLRAPGPSARSVARRLGSTWPEAPAYAVGERRGDRPGHGVGQGERAAVAGEPERETARAGLVVEDPVCAVVGRSGVVRRLPEVDREGRVDGFTGLLPVVAGPGRVAVQQSRDELLAEQGWRRFSRRPGDRAARDGPRRARPPRRSPRLVDGGHRAGWRGSRVSTQLNQGVSSPVIWTMSPAPAAVVQQLAAQGLGEALDVVLGPAVRRPQRNAALGCPGRDRPGQWCRGRAGACVAGRPGCRGRSRSR